MVGDRRNAKDEGAVETGARGMTRARVEAQRDAVGDAGAMGHAPVSVTRGTGWAPWVRSNESCVRRRASVQTWALATPN
jgi:hypothetical protein